MKSIATELVNDYKSLRNNLLENNIMTKIKAKAHALTCQTILDVYGGELESNLYDWCESEIKILKDGGLI